MAAELGSTTSARALVPGDPDAVDALASRLAVLADGLGGAAGRLRAIDSGDWQGSAGDAFRGAIEQEPGRYETAAAAFAEATGALRTYAGALRDAQAEAAQAVAEYERAEQETRAWQERCTAYEQTRQAAAAGDADAQSRLLSDAPPPADDLGAGGRARAQSLLAAARETVESAGRGAASRLDAARQHAPHKPTWFQRAVHGAGEFFKGAGEATWGLAEFGYQISPMHAMVDPEGWSSDMTDLGRGLVYGVEHPVEFGKAIVDWDTWSKNPARALGHLVPTIVLTLATAGAGGGASAAVKGEEAAAVLAEGGHAARGAQALWEVTASERAAAAESRGALPRAEELARTVNPVPSLERKPRSLKTTGSDGEATLSGWKLPRPDPFVHATPEQVRGLADEIGHALRPAGPHDGVRYGGFPGEFNASHAEKQLSVVSPNEPIAVSQPMCPDCKAFFAKLAAHRDEVQVVTDTNGTWIFRPDGRVAHVPPGLELLEPRPASLWPPLAVGATSGTIASTRERP